MDDFEPMKIQIILEITDKETLDAYSNIDNSFIEDDLRNGTLMEMCDVVEIDECYHQQYPPWKNGKEGNFTFLVKEGNTCGHLTSHKGAE